jgi:TrmH family RNA methyltransferase
MGVRVVLFKPEVSGNVGAVARLMGNFDVQELVLIQPKCDHLSKESQDRAKHNKQILKKAVILDSLDQLECATLIATTARVGTDFNLPRSPLLPSQLAELVPVGADVGIVFGPEGPGLSNEEISKCDFTVSIPTTKRYAAMNLSHAVGIILYELFQARSLYHIASHIKSMGVAEKKQLLKMVDATIEGIDWDTHASRKETQLRLWHKIVGKSFLTNREAMAFMGFLRQIQKGK